MGNLDMQIWVVFSMKVVGSSTAVCWLVPLISGRVKRSRKLVGALSGRFHKISGRLSGPLGEWAGPSPHTIIIYFFLFRLVTDSHDSRYVVRRIPISAWLDNFQLAGPCPHNGTPLLIIIAFGDGLPGLSIRGQEEPAFGLARQMINWRDHARTMKILYFF